MGATVFISYRREGGEGFAQMFSEKLKKKRYRVFYDIESIGSGMFDERILREIEQTDVFLLILTRGALDRCIHEGDWVRREIAYALVLGKPIIPLFFRGFEFPTELPADIEKVALYNGVDIRDMNYLDSKLKQLCTMIDEAARDARSGVAAMQKPARPAAPKKQRAKKPATAVLPATEETPAIAPEMGPVKDVRCHSKLAEWYYRRGKYLLAAELGHSGALQWLEKNSSSYRGRPAEGKIGSKKRTEMREAYCRGRYCRHVFAEARDEDDAIIGFADTTKKFHEVAELGYIPAQMALADWYMHKNTGYLKGPAQAYFNLYRKVDPRQAFYWYMQAAEQGVGRAHFRLGELYEQGQGVSQNLRQAVHHYRLAAMKGDPDGQYCLGRCLEKGLGVPADRGQAAHWYKLAAAQGQRDAQSALVGLIE
ncbi:MAG: toll/interleukin-1 receptor domain-containing protein [Ruminococcaceae bacterium]|nr:toll/interleukin-1 receptor domain-containing protein [Oscillospiraceae bacterium]